MPFNSYNFILVFLPAFFLSYYLISDNFKNAIILIYSILFYVIGNYNNPLSIIILFSLLILNYFFGHLIVKYKRKSIYLSKIVLFFAIFLNSLIIILFKTGIIPYKMPLGISFYIFHFISILVDIYKYSYVEEYFSFSKYISYILYFPKILSGPIERYDDYMKSISNKYDFKECFIKGIFYFSVGLSLKCILADNISYIINQINVFGIESISILTSWIGVYSYTMRLYFDFAGYSLMAIGIANAMGMKLPINFDLPFCSKSIFEFWRRWHITLGRFFRDYVYIPLGGNFENKNILMQSRNLIIVWLITGLWHGFKINYIIWAMLICAFIIAEKLILNKVYKINSLIGRIVVIVFMPIFFLCFSIENIESLTIYLSRLIDINSITNMRDTMVIIKQYSKIFLIGILFLTKYPKMLMMYISRNKFLMIIISILLIILSSYMLKITANDSFRYFAF